MHLTQFIEASGMSEPWDLVLGFTMTTTSLMNQWQDKLDLRIQQGQAQAFGIWTLGYWTSLIDKTHDHSLSLILLKSVSNIVTSVTRSGDGQTFSITVPYKVPTNVQFKCCQNVWIGRWEYRCYCNTHLWTKVFGARAWNLSVAYEYC